RPPRSRSPISASACRRHSRRRCADRRRGRSRHGRSGRGWPPSGRVCPRSWSVLRIPGRVACHMHRVAGLGTLVRFPLISRCRRFSLGSVRQGRLRGKSVSDLGLCYLPAHEALSRLRARSLSPVVLLGAVIGRAGAVQGKVNSLTFTHFDRAIDEARKAEAKYARGARTRALEGLPVAVKDESAIKGMPTSGGSLIMKDDVADHTSEVNARILRAGGIVHARTATPEFSCAGYTWSRLWGITRNPWNPEFTPGGSSGGSGAALASGAATLATGSDIGGSIRIPASCCGVVGFKPPYGRNPEDP